MRSSPFKELAPQTWIGLFSYICFALSNINLQNWFALGMIATGLFWMFLANAWYFRYQDLSKRFNEFTGSN